eukprot:265543_1
MDTFSCLLLLGQIINAETNSLKCTESVNISNYAIYDDISSASDIKSKWSINIDRPTEHPLNETFLSFEWKRSNTIKIMGNITKFSFAALYKVQSDKNENHYINSTSQSHLYNYCSYPIPSSYKFNIESKWVESELSTNNHKIPGSDCKNSNDSFWDDPHSTLCDYPSYYLNNLDDIYVKIFECHSINNKEMTSYKWYHTPQQLSIFSDAAKRVKIVVYDNIEKQTYSVISNDDSYAIANLKNNRALSHPYNYIYKNASTYFNSPNNIHKWWNGDQRLLNSLMVVGDDLFESRTFETFLQNNNTIFTDSYLLQNY